MAVSPEERKRTLDDLRKEIGGRLNPEDEQVKARMKNHYQHQFTKAINDAKAHTKAMTPQRRCGMKGWLVKYMILSNY